MAKQQSMDCAFQVGGVAVPENAETAILTSPAVSTPLEVNHLAVHFSCIVENATAGAGYNFKLYRGASTADALAYSTGGLFPNVAGGGSVPLSLDFAEYLSGTDFAQYTVSATMTGVATASTVAGSFIQVESL